MKASEILKTIFSSQLDHCTFGRGGDELNGLRSNSVPENCHVIDKFTGRQRDRTFYLLTVGDTICLIRICVAMHGSGYEEFAVLHDCGTDDVGEAIKDKFNRWKGSL
jgi:hypothetical protein